MNDLLAYCGIVCNTCPIYLATREENKLEQVKKKEEVARLIREHYKVKCGPEDITDCDGCRTVDGRLFSACADCAVRNCAKQKLLENCAFYSEYICDKLEAFFVKDPLAKTRLDEIRNRMS